MSTLVFLEHHGSSIQKTSLGVLSKAASLDPDTAGVVIGSGLSGLEAIAGKYGAKTLYVADNEALDAPLPQGRVDVISRLVKDKGFDTVLFAGLGARLRHCRRPVGSARCRPQLGPQRPRAPERHACRQARGAWRHDPCRPGLDRRSQARTDPRRLVRPGRSRRNGVRRGDLHRHRGVLVAGHDGRTGPRGADRAVDRGSRSPHHGRSRTRHARELRAPRRPRRRDRWGGCLDPRGRRLWLVPLSDPDRPDAARSSHQSSTSARASRVRSSTRSACRPRR